jgi:hypothetical protein
MAPIDSGGSWHHFPLLTEVLRCLELPDQDGKEGGVLLVFADENGAQVNVRLRRTTADRLLRILEAGPPKAQS